jgi:hypothetical protein
MSRFIAAFGLALVLLPSFAGSLAGASVSGIVCALGVNPDTVVGVSTITFSPPLTGIAQSGTYTSNVTFACGRVDVLPCASPPGGCESVYGVLGASGSAPYFGDCQLATLNNAAILVGGTALVGTGTYPGTQLHWGLVGIVASTNPCGLSTGIIEYTIANVGTT